MHHKHPAKHAIANSQRLSRARCLGKWKSGGTGDSLMCAQTYTHGKTGRAILSLFSASGNEKMSEVLMAIGADSSASWPAEEKARAKFTVIRQTSQQSCIGDHSSSSVRTQRKRTPRFIPTYPRAIHPHCSHYDPSSSPHWPPHHLQLPEALYTPIPRLSSYTISHRWGL